MAIRCRGRTALPEECDGRFRIVPPERAGRFLGQRRHQVRRAPRKRRQPVGPAHVAAVELATEHRAAPAESRAVLDDAGRIDDPLPKDAEKRAEIELARVGRECRARLGVETAGAHDRVLALIEPEPGHGRGVQDAVGSSLEEAVTPQVPLRRAQNLLHLVGLRSRRHRENGRVTSVALLVQQATAHHREAGRNSVELQEAFLGIGRTVGQPNELGAIGMAAELPETRIIGQHARDPVVRQIDDHLGPYVLRLTGWGGGAGQGDGQEREGTRQSRRPGIAHAVPFRRRPGSPQLG